MSSEVNDNAASKVFALPELLENILLQVIEGDRGGGSSEDQHAKLTPIHNVLLSQRGDQTFRNTIAGSKKLQEGLWKLPQGPIFSEEPLDCINPFFQSVMSPHNPPFEHVETDAESSAGARKFYFQHPIICYLDRMSKSGVWKHMDLIRANTQAKQELDIRIFENEEDSHDGDEFCSPLEIRCTEGITVAKVIEEVQKNVDKRNALFNEDWEAIRQINASRSQEDSEESRPRQTCLEWRMGW